MAKYQGLTQFVLTGVDTTDAKGNPRATKQGTPYIILRCAEVGTGKNQEHMVMDAALVDQAKKMPLYKPFTMEIEYTQNGRENSVRISALKAVKE